MARNTKQYQQPVTGRRTGIAAAAVVVALCLAAITGALVYRNTRPYEPPAFDETALAGIPAPPEELGFGYGGAGAEDSFKVGLASSWVRAEDGSLPIWFTNPPENEAKLMIRILHGGTILYESGLVRPGEYVETLLPRAEMTAEPMDVQVSIYSFDADYHSLGTLRFAGTLA